LSSTSPHPWVDTTRFPIIVIAFPLESSVNELRGMAMRQFAAGFNEPVAVVTDLSQLRTGDPEARAIYVQFVRDMRTGAGNWVRATAVITQSTLQRSLLNLHEMLVGKTPYPLRAFSRREEAFPWIHAVLSSKASRLA